MAYIQRKAVPRKLKDGKRKRFTYYYLVETYREGGKHKKRVVGYLGNAETAIAKLEEHDASEEEKAKLFARLKSLITEEANATQTLRTA